MFSLRVTTSAIFHDVLLFEASLRLLLCYQSSGEFRGGSGGSGYIPLQSYEGVSNTCLATTGSHIATSLAFFFPSFSFFVTVSEGGGGVRGGRSEGKGRRGRRAKS